eukprot:Rmarinus@m.28716
MLFTDGDSSWWEIGAVEEVIDSKSYRCKWFRQKRGDRIFYEYNLSDEWCNDTRVYAKTFYVCTIPEECLDIVSPDKFALSDCVYESINQAAFREKEAKPNICQVPVPPRSSTVFDITVPERL